MRWVIYSFFVCALVTSLGALGACKDHGTGTVCGDGVVDEGEACDGSDLGGATCASLELGDGQLGCRMDCTLDHSGCEPNGECGDGARSGEEACDGSDLGGATCASLGFDDGTLGCSSACDLVSDLCCDHGCDPLDETRCSADQQSVEVCSSQAQGGACQGWELAQACGPNETCVGDGSDATCVGPCSDACGPVGTLRCEGNVVQICGVGTTGCLSWLEDTPCDFTEICTDLGAGPQCILQGQGQSCTDVQYISVPFSTMGGDMESDYGDHHTFTGPGCGNGFGPEAVFAVYLSQGEVLGARETSWSTARLTVLDTCATGPTTPCLASTESYEDSWTSLAYTAPADGVYYLVLEIEPNPFDPTMPAPYDLELDLLGPGDLAAGIWEEFYPGHLVDLEACSLSYTPDASATAGYSVQYACGAPAGFPIQPGSSADATTLSLGDNDFAEVALTMGGGFDLFGVSYSSLFVGSNGYVTFGAGDTARWDRFPLVPEYGVETMFGLPRIVGLFADLDPSQAGTIVVDRFSDHTAVTFDSVAVFGESGTVSFQMVIWSSGEIQVHYDVLGWVGGGMAGIASGGSYGPLPPASNLLPDPPDLGQVLFSELHWSPAAAPDPQGEFLELYNPGDVARRLDGCSIASGAGTYDFSGFVEVPAQGYAVFARDTDPATNGGITGAYPLAGTLAPWSGVAETLQLLCNAAVIDELPWLPLGVWPAGGSGVSLQLMSSARYAAVNDNPDFWCSSTLPYGGGDLGTPGAANSDCGATVLLEETFETDIPSPWTVTDAASDGVTWYFCDWPNGCGWNGTGSLSDGGYARTDGALGSAEGELLNTPSLAGTSYTSVWLQFSHELYVSGAPTAPYAEVQVSTDGAAWIPVTTYVTSLVQQRETVDLSAQVAGSPTFWIRFYYLQGTAFVNNWKLDDITVVAW